MPYELRQMDRFLTKDNPDKCRQYHYNFERQIPRLFHDGQVDSILDVIDYIKDECGPNSNLEITRLLVLSSRGKFADSLVGKATIGQMLAHRAEQDYSLLWSRWLDPFGAGTQLDNTHDRFTSFQTELGRQISSDSSLVNSSRAMGLFYAGQFDSAFDRIQSPTMERTALKKSYTEYVQQTKSMFPVDAHVAILTGNWNPQGVNRILGNHPEVGIQLGAEGPQFRVDGILAYRFGSAANAFAVDSLGVKVNTTKFNSWLIGGEVGFKLIDASRISTDLFVGLGYDQISSVTLATDPEEYKINGSLNVNVGLRQRVFLDKRSGWYLGLAARYSMVDYSNTGGTDLSGNTISVSLISGWSNNATRKQFMRKLNYKGDWRRR